MRTPEATEFLRITEDLEIVCNAITAAIAPELYESAQLTIQQLKQGEELNSIWDCVQNWASAYSGMSLIVNRVTPPHRDPGGAFSVYDLLISGGTHTHCSFDVREIGAHFSYLPGTVVGVCGNVLRHGVDSWDGGERICAAHFIRDAVHNRLNLPRPSLPSLRDYLCYTE